MQSISKFAWLLMVLPMLGSGVAVTTVRGQAPPVGPVAVAAPISAEMKVEAKITALEQRIKELESAKPSQPQPTLPMAKLLAPIVYEAAAEGQDPSPFPLIQDLAEPSVATSVFATSVFPGGSDAFMLRSADGQHMLRITGQIQADYHDYPRHGDSTDIDTFLLRRARLGIEADLFEHYEFRFLPDFGNNKVVIQDGFVNIHYWDAFQVQIGKFKEPVSYEQLVFDRFVPTLERSMIDQLTPQRDIGMMIHGEHLLADQVDYAAGFFNGEINADTDTDKIKDFAARIVWRPLNYSFLPDYLHLFQIGISGTTGKEQEQLSLTGVNNETLRTPGGVPWLTFVKTAVADGIRTRLAPEVSYFYNQLGVMAEYLRMDQQIQSGVNQTVTTKVGKKTIKTVILDQPEDVRFGGYQFTLTYLLTGETRTTYSEVLRPLRPFDPAHPLSNPGAWELVVRVSHLAVDPSIFQTGAAYQLANPNGNSDAATELTVGFNWYLNALVRMQFNWEHAWFQQPLLLGINTYFKQTDAALVRFQIIF